MKLPDARRSQENYRTLAAGYDATCRRTRHIRREAVAMLALQPGDVVVDVACGTGLSFPLLMEAIGPEGHLIGIEHSADMMAIARRRVESAGWANMTLIESSVESARLPMAFDAVLFHFTHDVLQSPAALDRLFECSKPGARLAVAGVKATPWWLAPMNLWVFARTRRYLTTFSGLRQPWRNLARHSPDLEIRPRLLHTAYLASGRLS